MLTRRIALATAATFAALPARAESFESFVANVKAEGRRNGIRDMTLAAAFGGVQPNAKVIELDHRQPSVSLTWAEYRDRFVPPSKQQLARENFQRERALLMKVEAAYGVDARVMNGIWGVESSWGAVRGNYKLVEALSTLAWDGRRGAYFRKELMNVLKILDGPDITPAKATGSWAGAMGQPQFMPSSYLAYAVDFDGDGRRDIWDSKADVCASMANYLAKNGWRPGEPWGQPIRLPPSFNLLAAGRDTKRPLGEWMRQGVTRSDGTQFTRLDVMGAVLVPDSVVGGDAFMVYPNYNVIRRYNSPDAYALSVGLLADASA